MSTVADEAAESLPHHDGEEPLEEGTNGRGTRPDGGPDRKRVRLSLGMRDTAALPSDSAEAPRRSGGAAAVTPCTGPRGAMPRSALSREEIDALLWREAAYSSVRDEAAVASPGAGLGPVTPAPAPAGSTTSSTSTAASTSAAARPVVRKRVDYLAWDDYFLAVAALSARRSKDPHRPTGACLVDARNRVVGIGYNGFPRRCSDELLPWTAAAPREATANATGDAGATPRLAPAHFVVHAAVNAVLNKCCEHAAGCRLYCPTFPCHDCAKIIVQSRVERVLYCHGGTAGGCFCRRGSRGHGNEADEEEERRSLAASRILLTMAGVELMQIQPGRAAIELDLAGGAGRGTDPSGAAQGCCDSIGSTGSDGGDTSADEEVSPTSTTSSSSAVALAQDSLDEFHRQLLIREANYDPLLHPPTKRRAEEVLSWDDYFTCMALLTAQRSKDPNTQVGACLVDDQKRIIGLGYNGFPSGCSDDDLPWARQADHALHCKYPYVCHAEVNAILNKGSADVRGATLYVALFPCNECAKVIVQAGIREVVYIHDYYHDTDACRASRILFRMAGVRLRRHVPQTRSVRIELAGAGAVDTAAAGR